MKQDIEMFSRIEGYLNGTLNESEKNNFETELAENTELQQEVEASRLANLALMRNKLWDIKNLSAAIDQEEKQARKTKRNAAIATGLTLLVAGVAYLMVSNNEQTTQTQTDTKTQTLKTEQAVSPKETEPVIASTSNQTKNFSSTETKKTTESKQEETDYTAPPIVSESKEILVEKVEPTKPTQTTEPQKQTETAKADICATTNLEAYISTEKACVGDQNGRIQVSGFKGGQAPYSFKIVDQTKQTIPATRLGAGTYSVVISDQNLCTKTIKEVVVKEEDCRKDFELNASNGETVELGIASPSASFSVYDKAGNSYFYKQFAEGETIIWNGAATNGEAQSGYFIFMIKYQDGKTKQGSVTVVR
jgi:hypothetical protein